MILGAQLTLMMGPAVAVPVPPALAEALSSVEVTHTDQGKSGFQLRFQVGRSGPLDLVDFPLVGHPLLRPFTRVVLVVRFDLLPRVLMDGVVTQVTLAPGEEPGASTLTVTGEDGTVMMDLHQKAVPYPGMSEPKIVAAILTQYVIPLGLVPQIVPPLTIDVPVPSRRIPQQNGTDLQHLVALASRFAYVFYVEPTLVPMVNKAYWGPPVVTGPPQKALSTNMGSASNVSSISFQYNALSPTLVKGLVQDTDTNLPLPVITPPVGVRPPMAAVPAFLANSGTVRTTLLARAHETVENAMAAGDGMTRAHAQAAVGVSAAQAYALATAGVQASLERTVTATGELDALQYGDILRARGTVGVRGAGLTHDGNYYVQSVTHSIRKGEYKQRFTLNREGTHPLVPLVRP